MAAERADDRPHRPGNVFVAGVEGGLVAVVPGRRPRAAARARDRSGETSCREASGKRSPHGSDLRDVHRRRSRRSRPPGPARPGPRDGRSGRPIPRGRRQKRRWMRGMSPAPPETRRDVTETGDRSTNACLIRCVANGLRMMFPWHMISSALRRRAARCRSACRIADGSDASVVFRRRG